MSPVLDLLQRIRGRLGMYIGKQSLIRLAAFLHGYEFRLIETKDQGDPFLANFRDWIYQRYQTTAMSWEDAIVSHSPNDEAAVGHFWKLLDEFLIQQRQLLSLPVTTPAAANLTARP